MQDLQATSGAHLEFDQLCATIDEFEPLPEWATPRAAQVTAQGGDTAGDEDTEFDELILAGLVCPV